MLTKLLMRPGVGSAGAATELIQALQQIGATATLPWVQALFLKPLIPLHLTVFPWCIGKIERLNAD